LGNRGRHGQQHPVCAWRLDAHPQRGLRLAAAVRGERASNRFDYRVEVEQPREFAAAQE
jgi:hypothetical protein